MIILNILPLNYFLHTPHFRSRYEMMPNNWKIHVLVTGDVAMDGEQFGRVCLHVISPPEKISLWGIIRQTWALIVRGILLARKENIDVVISYDPLTLGIVGVLVKLVSKAKLVVEVNGHIRDAKAATLAGYRVGFIRRKLYNLVASFSLFMADCVKILNYEQFKEWNFILKNKRVVMFHDYVPTSQFSISNIDDSFVFCLGYPYLLKGVDILLKAFALIQLEFPSMQLLIMGYCSEQELNWWRSQAHNIDNIRFHKPVSYEQVGNFMSRCTVFVTASRSEGMGRVFIEAMASGKPCIGTRIGGIPNVIEDGISGYLVNPEDPEDLASKLRTLLADKELRQKMGKVGRRIAETKLSDRQYICNFNKMLNIVQKDKVLCKGICFNGFDYYSELFASDD